MRWKTKTFSLLLTGQGISLLGNSMLDLALSMYVLEVTGSAAHFAAFLAAAMVPTILCVRPVPASGDGADSHAGQSDGIHSLLFSLCPTTGPDLVWRTF